MRSVYRWFLVFMFVVSRSSISSGDIMVGYTGGTVAAGGSGILNVWVSSNADPGTPDNLDLFQLQFQISSLGSGILEFANPQSESHLGTGQYVLSGDSVGELNPGISTVSDFLGTNDQLDSLDATQSFNGVDLSTATGQKLLFRLDLNASGAVDGDQFEIALIDGMSQFSNANGDLYVTTLAPLGGPLELNASSFNAFTITATAAVPEPATGLVLLGGTLAGFWWKRRRRQLEIT